MKKLILFLCLSTAAIPVSAAGKPKYVDASIGYFVDSGKLMYSGRFGVEFSGDERRNHSGEIELGYTQLDIPGASVDVIPLLLNYKYTFPLQGKLDLFAGAGAGFSYLKFGVATQSDTDFPFTYQVIAGFEYRVSDRTSLTLGTRYYDIGNAEVFTIPYEIGNDVEVRGGFRFQF